MSDRSTDFAAASRIIIFARRLPPPTTIIIQDYLNIVTRIVCESETERKRKRGKEPWQIKSADGFALFRDFLRRLAETTRLTSQNPAWRIYKYLENSNILYLSVLLREFRDINDHTRVIS